MGHAFLLTALSWGMFWLVSQAVKGIENFGTRNTLSIAQNAPWFCGNLPEVQCEWVTAFPPESENEEIS